MTKDRSNNDQARTGEDILSEDFKREMRSVCESVHATGRQVDIVNKSGLPLFRLRPLGYASHEAIAAAVPVGVEKARKTYASIRSLLRIENDQEFLLNVGGKPMALFGRHPQCPPSAAIEYREIARERREAITRPLVHERLERIEFLVGRIAAHLKIR